jgi:hypothetical protein
VTAPSFSAISFPLVSTVPTASCCTLCTSYGFIPQDSNLRSVKVAFTAEMNRLYRMDYAEKLQCSKQLKGRQRIIRTEHIMLLPGMFAAEGKPGFGHQLQRAQGASEIATVLRKFAPASRRMPIVPLCLLEHRSGPAGSCVDDVAAVKALCVACNAHLLRYTALDNGSTGEEGKGAIVALFRRVRSMEEAVVRRWAEKFCAASDSR